MNELFLPIISLDIQPALSAVYKILDIKTYCMSDASGMRLSN